MQWWKNIQYSSKRHERIQSKQDSKENLGVAQIERKLEKALRKHISEHTQEKSSPSSKFFPSAHEEESGWGSDPDVCSSEEAGRLLPEAPWGSAPCPLHAVLHWDIGLLCLDVEGQLQEEKKG